MKNTLINSVPDTKVINYICNRYEAHLCHTKSTQTTGN